ncbi:uncharacterized protein LOC144454428 isoform X3 [Phascolarctos cinereus]
MASPLDSKADSTQEFLKTQYFYWLLILWQQHTHMQLVDLAESFIQELGVAFSVAPPAVLLGSQRSAPGSALRSSLEFQKSAWKWWLDQSCATRTMGSQTVYLLAMIFISVLMSPSSSLLPILALLLVPLCSFLSLLFLETNFHFS